MDSSLWNLLFLSLKRSSDWERQLAHDNFSFALRLSKKRGQHKLFKKLKGLLIPSVENGNEDDWEKFAKKLDPIIQKHVHMERYQYTEEQWEVLERFFSRTELMIRCLEVARTDRREEWEAKIFTLPKEKENQ